MDNYTSQSLSTDSVNPAKICKLGITKPDFTKPLVTLPHGMICAFLNNKSKYIIPSTEKFFGGWNVPYIMLDSGSNSVSFTLRTGCRSLEGLFDQFCPGSDSDIDLPAFSWSCEVGSNAGPFNAPHLIIQHVDSSMFSLTIGQDLFEFSSLIPILRFHLGLNMAKELVSFCNAKNISCCGLQIVVEYVSFLTTLQKSFPDKAFAFGKE